MPDLSEWFLEKRLAICRTEDDGNGLGRAIFLAYSAMLYVAEIDVSPVAQAWCKRCISRLFSTVYMHSGRLQVKRGVPLEGSNEMFYQSPSRFNNQTKPLKSSWASTSHALSVRQHITQLTRHLVFGLLLLLASRMSHSVAPVAPQPIPTNIQGWSPNWLVGTTLELVSEARVFTMRFGEGGWVAVTAGQKGGPLTGPLLPWRIENGKLLIGFSAQPKDGLEFVSISGNKLTTRIEGRNESYDVSR